jgi:hypothetical protein
MFQAVKVHTSVAKLEIPVTPTDKPFVERIKPSKGYDVIQQKARNNVYRGFRRWK